MTPLSTDGDCWHQNAEIKFKGNVFYWTKCFYRLNGFVQYKWQRKIEEFYENVHVYLGYPGYPCTCFIV